VRTSVRFGTGNAVDIQLTMPTWTTSVWAGFHETTSFADTEPWMMWATRGTPGMFQAEVLAAQAGVPTVIAGTPVPAGQGEHTWTVERYGALVVFKRDGVETGSLPLGSPFSTALQVRLNNGGSAPVTFDQIRVRMASDPMPEVTLGAEEARP
jgi:hypothetical protein